MCGKIEKDFDNYSGMRQGLGPTQEQYKNIDKQCLKREKKRQDLMNDLKQEMEGQDEKLVYTDLSDYAFSQPILWFKSL